MLTNTKLVHQPHDHRRCINAALAYAKDLCEAENLRLTPTGNLFCACCGRVIALSEPTSCRTAGQIAGKPIAPPTIYRAVEFLLKVGLIHRIASLNAYIGCPFPTVTTATCL